MHELSICWSIARIADRNRAGRRVRRVGIQLGALRQVVPRTLTSCWEAVTDSTPLAGTTLDVEVVPLVIACRDCGGETSPGQTRLRCPDCGSRAVAVVRGEEFCVTYLDVADEEACGGLGRAREPPYRCSVHSPGE